MARSLVVLSVLLLTTAVRGFDVDRAITFNHQNIIKSAILDATVKACSDIAQRDRRTFASPAKPYTVKNVLEACQASAAFKLFHQNIKFVQNNNILVDRSNLYASPEFHFNNEEFTAGRDIIAAGLMAVKLSIIKGNNEAANELLGKITHTLSDFYSHSNWIELGNKVPKTNLLKGNENLDADRNRATCQDCSDSGCNNNILEGIITGKILTSGFFSLKPSTDKPAGKCSNGGALDESRTVSPKGGIGKDRPDSKHGHLHVDAAYMAMNASVELLDDIRAAVGDVAFLRMIAGGTGKVLCFVIDNSGSMGNEIKAVEQIASLLTSNVGILRQQQHTEYILVTFNDPSIGEVQRFSTPEEFKNGINSIETMAGGDKPEKALSGLQMALKASPPGSDIFLFTDAAAKDASMKNSVSALIESKKSVVNVLLTGILDSLSDAAVYEDLALASGGQLIRMPEGELGLAGDFIKDASSSSMVTLMEEVRNPGNSENFTFLMDNAISNVKVYTTGLPSSVDFENPSGNAQTAVASSNTIGNFQRISLNKDVGLWKMKVVSDNPYSVRIVGESPITFLSSPVHESSGPITGPVAHNSRLRAGVTNSLELTLLGSETATVTEAYLVEKTSALQVGGTVTDLGDQDYSAKFVNIPAKELSLLVKGLNSGNTFQRLLPGTYKTSSLFVTADVVGGIIEPGKTESVLFSVASDNPGTYTVKVENDKDFPVASPSSVTLTGGKAQGKLLITAPDNVESGTHVTLAIYVQAPGGTDMNFAFLSFTVLKKVNDYSGPICNSGYWTNSSRSNTTIWSLNFQVSDNNGIYRVQSKNVSISNEELTVDKIGDVAFVRYGGAACPRGLDVTVVDRVGNVGSCSFTRDFSCEPTSMSPKLVHSSLLWLGLLVIRFIG